MRWSVQEFGGGRAGVHGRAQERRREGGQGGAWLHIDQSAHHISIIYIYISVWSRDTLQAAVAEVGRGREGGAGRNVHRAGCLLQYASCSAQDSASS